MLDTGYAWGTAYGEWLTIPGSHHRAPVLAHTPVEAQHIHPETDTLALVERWTHPGVSSGRAFKILEVVKKA